MIDTIRDWLDTFAGNLLYWLTRYVDVVIIVLSVVVILEGLILLILPNQLKKRIERLPIPVFRILGGVILIGGGLVLYLYLRILRYLQ